MFAKSKAKRRADQASLELALMQLESEGLAVKRNGRYFLAPGVKIETVEFS